MELLFVQGVVLSGSGALIAALGTFGLTRPVTDTLFGSAASDPTPFAAAALLVAGVAFLAIYSAARRSE